MLQNDVIAGKFVNDVLARVAERIGEERMRERCAVFVENTGVLGGDGLGPLAAEIRGLKPYRDGWQ